MPFYTFDVTASYRTDPIYAENEYKARLIANGNLQYDGEEHDTEIVLVDVEEDEED